MRSGKNRKLIALIVLMLLLIAAGVFVVGRQLSRPAAPPEETTEDSGGEAEETAEPLDILLFASDYQYMYSWDDPAVTLRSIIGAVKKDGKIPTNVIYCGDYTNDRKLHDYQLSPDESIEEIRSIVGEELPGVDQGDMIFEQGNHDRMTASLSESGLHEYDNYLIYALNTENDFPWKQGRNTEFKDRVIRASEEMKACFDELIAKGETRPVFIAGHVPIHFTARTTSRHNTGDNMYAEYIFDVVNEAGNSLDIVYLFGHNHSKGWDCYLGGSSVFKSPGDTILIPDAGSNTVNTDNYSVETLSFTYMNAGYTGYYMNCGPEELDNGTYGNYKAADDTLTATVVEIMPDELIITRYSAEGIHPLGWQGEADPYKGYIDAGLIGEEYYSKQVPGPVSIERKHN
ncbi:MAG: metallophosphoesterase [Mogibacterium sp.]|nr:metallophosphoesterase [Mogibacterium sp.]